MAPLYAYEVWLTVDRRLNLGRRKKMMSRLGLDDPDRMPDLHVRAHNLVMAKRKAMRRAPKGVVIERIQREW